MNEAPCEGDSSKELFEPLNDFPVNNSTSDSRRKKALSLQSGLTAFFRLLHEFVHEWLIVCARSQEDEGPISFTQVLSSEGKGRANLHASAFF